ncbi:LADA_0H12420g1_1 [Lachancea dasiensis]|uniref:LADA_0H12420g1_1 n=1 Tax=Lachancea dasiensis TaxID=1072105 RepID=A0A1G4K427_9SACH|nr:LADA_0H12420g1_1 [Lachancea dasiensis]
MRTYIWWLWISLAGVWADCDFIRLSKRSQGLQYDEHALPQYADIAAQLSLCKTPQAEALRHQLLYKSGLIQISIGDELRAMETFQEIVNSGETSNYVPLSQNRLQEIYQQFGLWDKIGSSPLRDRYISLMEALSSHVDREEQVPIELKNELFDLSPFSIELRVLINDALYYELSKTLSINVAQSIIENYKVVLGKHRRHVSVAEKLKIYTSMSALQLFVMAVPPTNLMSCLALDMDYRPCRELSKIVSKINSVSPPFAAISHADQFLELNHFQWDKLLNFYVGDAKLIKYNGLGNGKNNLGLLRRLQQVLLSDVLANRPLSQIKRKWTLPTSGRSALEVLQDLMLCEAYDQMLNLKTADAYFNDVVSEKLSSDEQAILNGFVNNFQSMDNINEVLHNLWQDFPSLALHAVRKSLKTLLSRGKNVGGSDRDQVWALLENFAKNHNWETSSNEGVVGALRTIASHTKRIREEQAKFQQQRQQQQRQQHNFFRQQQQHSSPPAASDLSKKDLYKVLGLSQHASAKDIRKSYLTFTRKYHPDKQGQLTVKEKQKNEEKMSQINEAYEILSNEEKRKEYDLQRTGSRGHQRRRASFSNGGGFPFGGGNFKMNFGGFS